MKKYLITMGMVPAMFLSGKATLEQVKSLNATSLVQAAVVSYQMDTGDLRTPSVEKLVAWGYLNKSVEQVALVKKGTHTT
jgi:competence protein ComGC